MTSVVIRGQSIPITMLFAQSTLDAYEFQQDADRADGAATISVSFPGFPGYRMQIEIDLADSHQHGELCDADCVAGLRTADGLCVLNTMTVRDLTAPYVPWTVILRELGRSPPSVSIA